MADLKACGESARLSSLVFIRGVSGALGAARWGHGLRGLRCCKVQLPSPDTCVWVFVLMLAQGERPSQSQACPCVLLGSLRAPGVPPCRDSPMRLFHKLRALLWSSFIIFICSQFFSPIGFMPTLSLCLNRCLSSLSGVFMWSNPTPSGLCFLFRLSKLRYCLL